MSEVKRYPIGILTFFAILVILSIAVTLLTILNLPRFIPNKKLKQVLGLFSNKMGSITVASITTSLKILHRLDWDFQIPETLTTDFCYIAISTHPSCADLFILFYAAHLTLPLLLFFLFFLLPFLPLIYILLFNIDIPLLICL